MKLPKYGLTQAEHAALVARTGRPATHDALAPTNATMGKDGDLSILELRASLGLNHSRPGSEDEDDD